MILVLFMLWIKVAASSVAFLRYHSCICWNYNGEPEPLIKVKVIKWHCTIDMHPLLYAWRVSSRMSVWKLTIVKTLK
jgi:hypothetical protein